MSVGRQRSGFTLLELMTVIALIAIIASIALPNFLSWLPRRKMTSAARETLSALRLARLTAVRENAIVSVCFNRADSTYTVFVDNSDDGRRNGIQDAGERTILGGKIPSGIRFEHTSVDFFPFNSRGHFDLLGGSVILKSGSESKTVRVTNWGSIRIVTN